MAMGDEGGTESGEKSTRLLQEAEQGVGGWAAEVWLVGCVGDLNRRPTNTPRHSKSIDDFIDLQTRHVQKTPKNK